MRLFVFGLGYSALAYIRVACADAERIVGTVRSPDHAERLARTEGVVGVPFDGPKPSAAVREELARATHLLVSIPPDAAGDPALAAHRADIVAAPALRSIVYLSTVGVYGDHGGGWVDEATPPRPTSDRSLARLAAEESWRELASATGIPLAILRLSGIYGPGRNALSNLADGSARRLVKPGQVFNRIHVEDIAAAIGAAFRAAATGVFNVTDDEPAPPQDVVTFAAGLAGIALPPEIPFDSAALSPMARSFYAENKRVRNARLKREFLAALRFPTYREGLRALAAAGEYRAGLAAEASRADVKEEPSARGGP